MCAQVHIAVHVLIISVENYKALTGHYTERSGRLDMPQQWLHIILQRTRQMGAQTDTWEIEKDVQRRKTTVVQRQR